MAMKMIANHGTEEIPSSESTGEEELESVRRIDGCINCGEEREIAAHGLCFKCYRKKERDDDRKFAGVDRHNPGLNKEHTKLLRGFTQVMVGLSDLGVSEADVLSVRRILEPYLVLVANFLALASDRDKVEGGVNSEQKSGEVFTVHRTLSSSAEKAREKL